MTDNPYQSPRTEAPRKSARPRPAPICGLVSIAALPAAIVFLIGLATVIEALAGRPSDRLWKAIQIAWLISTALVFFGSVVAAFARRERRLWLPLAGMAITGSIVAAVAIAVINDYPD